MQCDRTGATQIVDVILCPAHQDYVDLINSRGGIEGYKIRADEIDSEYKVPPTVEAYERHKAEGAVSIMLYGTPQTQALTQKLNEDKIPGTSPGFGTSAAANGGRYPYLFPIAASYWSQGAAAIKFVQDQLGGSLEGPSHQDYATSRRAPSRRSTWSNEVSGACRFATTSWPTAHERDGCVGVAQTSGWRPPAVRVHVP